MCTCVYQLMYAHTTYTVYTVYVYAPVITCYLGLDISASWISWHSKIAQIVICVFWGLLQGIRTMILPSYSLCRWACHTLLERLTDSYIVIYCYKYIVMTLPSALSNKLRLLITIWREKSVAWKVEFWLVSHPVGCRCQWISSSDQFYWSNWVFNVTGKAVGV